MKKRVRIYKPTNRFQEGGEQGMQFTPDQLISIYMAALAEPGASTNNAEDALRQIGVDEETIAQISATAEEYMDEQQYLNEAVSTGDEDDLADISADQAAIDAAAESERSALELAEEEARSDAMQQMYADYSEPDYGDDSEMAGELIQRYGGVPSKRTFVKNVMKQVKKQMGGPSEPARVDSTDPDNKRKEGLLAFVSTVQEKADEDLMRKDAEAVYSMMTTPIGGDESYYESPDMDYAQFGGMRRGQARRMNRRLNRMVRRMPIDFYGGLPGVYTYPSMPGMMPMMPSQGSVYGGPRLANIDVRRVGLFGKPKEYSITFADDVITNPQLTQEVIKQEQKNKEQEIADEVKAAEEGTVDQGVEEKKESEAQKAIDAAEEAAVDINDIQVVSEKTPSKSTSRGKTDAWGRTPDNKWYGFDPKTKKWTKGTPDWAKKKTEEVKKKTVQEYQPIVEGTSYTVSDSNPRPLPNISKGKPSNKKVVEPTLRQYAENFMPHWFTPTNMTNVVPRSTPREPINIAEKFPFGGATDQASGLYMFLYGGDDSGQSKLDNSPYFRDGGLYRFQGEGDSAVDSESNAKKKDSPSYLTKEDLDSWAKSMGLGNNQGVTYGPYPGAPINYGYNPNRMGYRDPYSGWDGTGSPPYITASNAPEEWKRAHPEYYNQRPIGYGMPITKQKRMPYMTGTRQIYTGDLSDARVKSIDVKKSGLLSGMPKKYTINYQVQKHPLTGQITTAPATQTKQGIFNRGERQQMFGKRPDTAVESRSRALSWLGSKLRPGYTDGESESGRIYTPEEQKMLRRGFDPDTGLTPEELARKRERDAISNETFAFTPPEVSDTDWATEMPIPERVELNRLPLRRPSELLIERTAREPIVQDYRQPDFSKGYVAPEVMLEPDYGQVPASTVEPQSAFQYSLPEEFTQPEPQPMTEESYTAAMADEDELANQDFMMQQMAMQNPDFYNQDVYDWQPDLSGSEMAELNLNPPPPQAVTAETVTPYTRPTRRVTPSRRQQAPVSQRTVPQQTERTAAQQTQGTVPRKSSAPVKPVETAKVKQIIKDAKKENVPASKTVNGVYDFDAAVKGMSRSEKADYQNRMGEASSQLRDLRSQAIGTENPQLWRDTYRNYKIPDTYIKTFNKLNPAQRLAYIKGIKKADGDLYNALLYMYAKRYGGYMAYGGTLPQAYIGEDTPIDQDERFAPDYESVNWGADFNQDNIPDYLGASTTDMNWKNNTDWMQKPFGFDEQGQYSIQKAVEDQNPQYEDVSVDYKTKWGDRGANRRMWLDMFNTGADKVLGWIGQRGDARRERMLNENLLADRLYGSTRKRNKGDYRVNEGDIAYMGQREFGPQGRYGGMMYKEGGVTWLSPSQVKWIMDNGGDIEFMQ